MNSCVVLIPLFPGPKVSLFNLLCPNILNHGYFFFLPSRKNTGRKKNVLEKSYSEAYIFVNYLISFRFRCFYLNKTLIVSFRFQNSMKKTSEVVFWDKFILNRSLKELFLETISKNYLWRANQPKLQTQFISKEA